MHRPLPSPLKLLALTVVAMVLVTLAPAVADADQLRGAQVHSLWSNESTPDALREIDMLADAGATPCGSTSPGPASRPRARVSTAPGSSIAPTPSSSTPTSAASKVVGVLWSTPCWASSAPDSLKQGCAGDWWNRDVDRYAPANMDDFGDAAAFVAKRWGSELAGLEIWNEPNLADQYTLHTSDPAGVDAQLLKTAYPRIKAEAPQLPVIAGVLCRAPTATS